MDPKTAQSGAQSLFVAVVGPATAEAAAAEGFLVGHMAEEFQGISLARELAAELTRKKVLIPHGDLATEDLTVALRFAGADVTEVTTYRTLEVDSAAPEALEALRKGEVDIVSFFSRVGVSVGEQAGGGRCAWTSCDCCDWSGDGGCDSRGGIEGGGGIESADGEGVYCDVAGAFFGAGGFVT